MPGPPHPTSVRTSAHRDRTRLALLAVTLLALLAAAVSGVDGQTGTGPAVGGAPGEDALSLSMDDALSLAMVELLGDAAPGGR